MQNIFDSDIKKSDGKKYYIWHCPNLDCKSKGIVLFKTISPFIGDGKIKCANCGKIYDFNEITKENKRNIDRYIGEICQ